MEFSGISKEYRAMLRNAISEDDADKRPLKKRKKSRKSRLKEDELQDNSSREEGSSVDIEILDYTEREPTPVISNPVIGGSGKTVVQLDDNGGYKEKDVEDEDDDDEDDFDDFEDVDLDNVQEKASAKVTGDIVVSYNRSEQEELKKKNKKKTHNICDKQERQFRKNFHLSHIAIMMLHGFIRNIWCNNESIHTSLRKLISTSIYDQLHPAASSDIPQIRTRKFLDGLKQLMTKWIKYYKVTSNKGIHKHDWYDWYDIERSNVNFERFKRCLTKGRGNRDIGAQGFVALLRAADVPSRLVYSLQPPDFTSLQIKENKKAPVENERIVSVKDRVIALRKGKISVSNTAHRPLQGEIELSHPVFWAEAWDSASKTWITVDPIMFKIIENVNIKSKLEPSLSNPYNTLTYVIGYDRKGGVRDVTKRYAEKYYSKTRKKRITKEESGEIWLTDFIEHLSQRPRNRADDFEDEYFLKKAEKEGMPDNIQDFKNHPFFVLEMHLRSNEVLYPKESCGMIRIKGKNEALPVYKASNVQQLKSPRAWFQTGRVLKPGAQPLKTKKKTSFQMKGDDDDTEERLYAEFQTDLYVPPPVEDGLITKNAYGNVDCYVPSMIPKGAVHIDTPLVEDAAKMLGIDYAPACVGFKFSKRQATPRLEGIIVAEEFREAVESVQQQLIEEAHEKQRIQLEIRALKGWDLLLTKLKIKHRLNKSHGRVDEEYSDSEQLEKEYEEYLANIKSESEDESDDDESDEGFGGGFLPAEGIYNSSDESDSGPGFTKDRRQLDSGFTGDIRGGFIDRERDTGAGFIVDHEDSGVESSTGFIANEDSAADSQTGTLMEEETDVEQNDIGGGFIAESSKEQREELDDHDEEINELDEYEKFFEQLGNQDHDEDDVDKEVGADEVSSLGIEEQRRNEIPEQSDFPPATFKSPNNSVKAGDFELCEGNRITTQGNESSFAKVEEETMAYKEVKAKVSKEPTFDKEMEEQFNQQLQEESSNSGAADPDDEDYEFEYDSE